MSTSANEGSAPPLHVLLEINKATADMQRLVLLDAAWTRATEGGDELGERDRETLVSLGNETDAQLATAERHAHTLRQTSPAGARITVRLVTTTTHSSTAGLRNSWWMPG